MSRAQGGEGGPHRVLWLVRGLGWGGTERLLSLMAPRVDPDRFAVEVAYVVAAKDAMVPTLEATGARVRSLGSGPSGRRTWPVRLGRLVAGGDHDLIHTHSPVSALVPRVARRAGTPLVHTEHSAWDRYRVPTRVANRLTYGRNTHVFAVSGGVAASIATRGPRPPVELLHHGVDASAVPSGAAARAAARRELGVPDDAVVVGTIGSLSAKKDQATLVDAFARLGPAADGARLVIVGGGPLEQDLRAQVRAAGLDRAVTMTGPVPDAARLVAGFDVFALSSRHEGLGLVLLEAMAAGVPVVATAVDGVPEVVDHGVNGLLVPPGDPAALAAAVERFLGEPTLAAATVAAGRTTSDRFSIDHAVRRMEAVYEELIAVAATRRARRR